MTTRRRIRLHRRLAERDGWQCRYCSRSLSADDEALTVDHVIPRSRGGSSDLGNLVLACQPCNTLKGSGVHWLPGSPPGVPLDSTCRHTTAAAICLNCAGP